MARSTDQKYVAKKKTDAKGNEILRISKRRGEDLKGGGVRKAAESMVGKAVDALKGTGVGKAVKNLRGGTTKDEKKDMRSRT